MHRLPPETAAHVMQHLGQENIQALHRVSKKTHAAVLNAKPYLLAAAKELYARSSASPEVTQYIDKSEEMLAIMKAIQTSLNHLVQNQRDIQARLRHAEMSRAAWENVLRPLFPPSARRVRMETHDSDGDFTIHYHFKYKITYGYVHVRLWLQNMILDTAIVYNLKFSKDPANESVTPHILVSNLVCTIRYDVDAPNSAEDFKLKKIHTEPSEIRTYIYPSTKIVTLVQIARDVDALKSFYNKHGLVVNVIIEDQYKKVLDMFKA